MKIILAAIGEFFARIWRWIVETAWIQPLLIVGTIFGVIFSIPSISSWISETSETSGQYKFYNKHKLKTTDLLKYYEDDDFSDILDETGRGLLVFIEKDCSECIAQEAAFKKFYKTTYENKSFKTGKPSIHFVYVDYDKDDVEDDEYAKAYWDLINNQTLDDLIHEYLADTYNPNLDIEYSDSDWSDGEGINDTPTIVSYNENGINKVLLGLNSGTTTEQANYLRDFYYEINDWDF